MLMLDKAFRYRIIAVTAVTVMLLLATGQMPVLESTIRSFETLFYRPEMLLKNIDKFIHSRVFFDFLHYAIMAAAAYSVAVTVTLTIRHIVSYCFHVFHKVNKIKPSIDGLSLNIKHSDSETPMHLNLTIKEKTVLRI